MNAILLTTNKMENISKNTSCIEQQSLRASDYRICYLTASVQDKCSGNDFPLAKAEDEKGNLKNLCMNVPYRDPWTNKIELPENVTVVWCPNQQMYSAPH